MIWTAFIDMIVYALSGILATIDIPDMPDGFTEFVDFITLYIGRGVNFLCCFFSPSIVTSVVTIILLVLSVYIGTKIVSLVMWVLEMFF